MRFLVIDDNNRINQSIVDCLGKLGSCDSAYDGADGLYMADAKAYDLIITEVLLPKKSGFEIIKTLRKTGNCPIMIVSALNSVDKKIEGLRLGADDYMTKPFDKDELLARTEALLRRFNNNFQNKYVNGELQLDYSNKMFSIRGEYIKLSGKIYDILECLIRSRNMIVSKDQLFNRIWGLDSETVVTVVEVYVSKLRKILENYGYGEYLKTVKNLGYMWLDKDASTLDKG
ncbi:MAG: response regulator transcription factor [Clostridia bacterium]|nr:response regulator transcription factor [Clostridia bacterium]